MNKLRALNTPVFWAEGRPGILCRDGWTVEIGGLVLRLASLSWEDILASPKAVESLD